VADFLDKEHVAILPGAIFGSRWKNYVRMSFAIPDESLYPAIKKFGEKY